ncbi:MAG: hypothetical protein LBD24_02915 [Spirochaetaceae bacterium]|nr:hypothetical protein [Spirochaetaceae bacterium]
MRRVAGRFCTTRRRRAVGDGDVSRRRAVSGLRVLCRGNGKLMKQPEAAPRL